MVVWSDPRVQKLAREFVCTTEEVDILFPRNKWLINHLKDDPAVRLFRDIYGRQAPRQHWDPNPVKTKQGVYAMMPDGTYLGGRFVGARPDRVLEMMREAHIRWKKLAKERKLNPKPVPQTEALADWKKQKQSELGLHVQLHYRDLPRNGTRHTKHGRKVGEHHNTTWLELSKEEAAALVPDNSDWKEIPNKVREKIFCKAFKDIVYGQSPDWKPADVRSGSIKVRRGKATRSGTVIELVGKFDLQDRTHRFSGDLLGKLLYSPQQKRISRMEAVATGTRSGGTTFNFRNGDESPAPLGVSLIVR